MSPSFHRISKCLIIFVGLWLTASGTMSCQSGPTSDKSWTPSAAPFDALREESPISIDDLRWRQARSYELVPSATDNKLRPGVSEPGRVQFMLTPTTVFVRFELTDLDLFSLAKANHDILYMAGDTIELFIGYPPTPVSKLSRAGNERQLAGGSYLELHVAPNGVQSAYVIHRPGLVEKLDSLPFQASVKTRGTLNQQHTDIDQGWSVLLAIDFETIQRLLGGQHNQQLLTVMAARYNYGYHIPRLLDGSGEPELTTCPQQPRTAFHLRPFHAPLIVNKQPGTTTP